MIYRGTSTVPWLMEGIILVFVVAFVLWIAWVLLLVAAACVVGFFVWVGLLEVHERWIDPPVRGWGEYESRQKLYGDLGKPPWKHRLPMPVEKMPRMGGSVGK